MTVEVTEPNRVGRLPGDFPDPAPGARRIPDQAAAPAGPGQPTAAVHVVTRQEALAAQASIKRLTELGVLLTRVLVAIGSGCLIFTCTNVTLFAMSRNVPGYIAWMLDPLASLALLTVLYVDGVLTEHGGERAGAWPAFLRWFAGISTWLMNSWTSWFPDGRFHLVPQHPDAGGLLLHSVAPMLLIALAEASSGYRRYLARKLKALREIVQAREDYEHTLKEQRERQARLDRERAERERTERDRADREAAAEYQRRESEAQLRKIEAEAEVEKLAAKTALLEREAEIEAARTAREAEIERERRRDERESEDARIRREAEIEATRLNSEAAREAERIKAQGEAQAARILAEAQVRERAEDLSRQRKKEDDDAEERRRKQEERLRIKQERGTSQTGDASSESQPRSGSRNPGRSSQTSVPPGSAAGTVPREARSALREQAEREVARRILEGEDISTEDQAVLANRYGKRATWVGDRMRSARRRLATDSDFELAVIASALEDQAPVSQETRDTEPAEVDEQHEHA